MNLPTIRISTVHTRPKMVLEKMKMIVVRRNMKQVVKSIKLCSTKIRQSYGITEQISFCQASRSNSTQKYIITRIKQNEK